MNRLQSELRRLYLPHPATEPGADADSASPTLIDAEGRVRAAVLALARPASWELLSRVWRGVQADLELPAPAIAVSGTDGFQLWFSLVEPVPAAQAHAFVALLCARYLGDVAPTRLGLMPSADASAHARWVPQEQAQGGNWSAFVAPDLAPVFVETPWLDTPPGSDGQADVLARLGSIKQPVFDAALARLRPSALALTSTGIAAGLTTATQPTASTESLEARRFLLRVMNDDTVALALRIEAAKALLSTAAHI
jgi:hypothetical protein